jgi:tRNA (guanine37-N1)-methyltransferase
VEEWRFEQSLSITKERRPDLYEKYVRDNPEIMAARQKRIDRQKRLEERRRNREQKRLQADTVPESRIEKQKS